MLGQRIRWLDEVGQECSAQVTNVEFVGKTVEVKIDLPGRTKWKNMSWEDWSNVKAGSTPVTSEEG